jgi:hypothetical protein
MSSLRLLAVLFVALAVVAGGVVAAETVKSGPQVGQQVPGPFHPLNVTGANAGEKCCLYCKNGNNPVAMLFAREMSEPVVKLIKKIDEATAQNDKCHMGSFVVFLNDSEDLAARLKEVAEKENIKNTVLSIDNPAGPRAYKVAQDADVTVVLYTDHTVKANHAYAKGSLNDKQIDAIVADVAKILPQQ